MAARLSHAEREEIACGVAAGKSFRQIGRELGRSASAVSREVGVGSNRDGSYRAHSAQRRAARRAKRPKRRRLADPQLQRLVARYLRERLSPQSISLLCARQGITISHETIYREIYRRDSYLPPQALRWLPRPRPGRHRRRRTSRRYQEPLEGFRSISQRPHRGGPGHWEGDLLIGSRNQSACVVLTETGTGYTLVGALPNGQSASAVTEVINQLFTQVPNRRRQTLTWDRGRELTQWRQIEADNHLQVFFCDPRSPWQKGLVEGTCGILRRWLPRHRPIPTNQTQLEAATYWINHMPRYKKAGATTTELYHRVATTT